MKCARNLGFSIEECRQQTRLHWSDRSQVAL
nr:hypothetical protein [uncultured Cohaesibacter sp.]